MYDRIAKDIPDIREYLTAKEVVAMFEVERGTLYREIHQGKIPSVNLGKRQIRLKRSDVEERYQLRKKVRKAAQKPIPKTYNLEPENCYTIGEISKKYRIHDTSVWAHIRKFSIPTRQIGNFAVFVSMNMTIRHYTQIQTLNRRLKMKDLYVISSSTLRN